MTGKHTAYHELLEALRRPGCALCQLGGRAASRFLDALLFEYINDGGIRDTLEASQGFCATHSTALVARHDALGTSILYNALLGRLQKTLQSLDVPPPPGLLQRLRSQIASGAADAAPLQPVVPCPACSQRDDAARRALEIMVLHSGDAELGAALNASAALCLPHLRAALGQLHGDAWQQVVARQLEVWQALRAELAEAIRKHDARFRHETFGPEEDAWRRAVELFSGMPGVF